MERGEQQPQSQSQQQEKRQQENEVITLMEDELGQNKQQITFQYSAKVEVNAKGYVQPHIHIYSNDRTKMVQETLESLEHLVHGLKARGFQVATDLASSSKQEL